MILHPVWADGRVQYPSHFKRFEVNMFAFAEDQDNLSQQVISALGKYALLVWCFVFFFFNFNN